MLLLVLYEISKRVYLKPTKNIADKKIWFFQTDKAFFQE
jgi:hypothetical protein